MGISEELHNLLENNLSRRFQRIILNGQHSSWKLIFAGVPQGSILGPLLFLICINQLVNELKSNVKLFADDTPLFTIVKDLNEFFSKKKKIQSNPIIRFNNIQVEKVPYQKHLGILLDEKLNFKQMLIVLS